MANALGTLFGEIASAIRETSGATGTMKPAKFPEKIREISAGVDTEDIDLFLDQINGEIIGEKKYVVTFVYGDQTYQEEVVEGRDCPDPVSAGKIETPTKEDSETGRYTFNGWSLTDGGAANANALKRVESDRIVYAAFEEIPINIAQGMCGASVYWKMNSLYAITIYGTGSMSDYNSFDETPWAEYKDNITEVVIESGVTTIGNSSFRGCTNLANITLPEGMEKIGDFVFINCSEIASVSLPSTLKYIGWSGFDSTNIKNITIPYGMVHFHSTSFPRKNLESIKFDRIDGWRYGSSLYHNTNYTELSNTEVLNYVVALEKLKGSGLSWWWNINNKEATG